MSRPGLDGGPEEMSVRLAYVSLRLRWSPGVYQKLVSQASAARRDDLSMKFFWLLPTQSIEGASSSISALECIEVRPGFGFLPRWMRTIYVRIQQVRFLNNLMKSYDAVVVRYPTFDPVVVLFLKPGNLVWEHHTNDTEELRSASFLRFFLEKAFRALMFRKSIAYTAISQEIVSSLSKPYEGRPGRLITNSLDFSAYQISEESVLIPDPLQLEWVMVASTYSLWHGLDRVLEALHRIRIESALVFHIVGLVPEELRTKLESQDYTAPNIRLELHGRLSQEQLISLYQRCCLGIGSFGLDQIAMNEGAPLKIREYLACGLPVYSGTIDSGLPEKFPYYFSQSSFSVSSAMEFVLRHKDSRRGLIRAEAERFLGTKAVSQDLIDFTASVIRTNTK